MHKNLCIWVAIGTFWGVVLIAFIGDSIIFPGAGTFLAGFFGGSVIFWAISKYRQTASIRNSRAYHGLQAEQAPRRWFENPQS